jgi:hypothetical protein
MGSRVPDPASGTVRVGNGAGFWGGDCARYDRETDIQYAAARLWLDAILDPAQTRDVLIMALDVAVRNRDVAPIGTGVFQV